MRTTLDLPITMLDEAMKISRHKTKTAVIIHALEDFLRKNRIQKIKRFRGKVDLNINLDVLRKRT